MTPAPKRRRLVAALVVAAAVMLGAASAQAESLAEFNRQLDALAPEVAGSLDNPAQAGSVVDRLDAAEAQFARIASSGRVNGGELMAAYDRLESMLERVYKTYRRKKDDCITLIDNGGKCDYNTPEQIELRALYPLSWLRFQGASTIYSTSPGQARRLLSQAIDGFTRSTLVIVAPNLIRENLLGRAFCERELGKYDSSEYAKAIADFRQIMKDGPGTRQYRAAEQGLATTYAAMGRVGMAAKLTRHLAAGSGGEQRAGIEMLRLKSLFKAEAAARDPARKAKYHREAVDFMKSIAGGKTGWSIVVAAVVENLADPIAEFGGSSDPFEQNLLANVLYAKKDFSRAAGYFLKAARSGKYPTDYKYAAEIYYKLRRYDLYQELLAEIAREPGNPAAQWASYMRFKFPRTQWEQTGMNNPGLESKWVSAGEEYLKKYPRSEHANEIRFRLAERRERARDYLGAARIYSAVSGGDWGFAARYNQAECDYRALVAASRGNHGTAPPPDVRALRKEAISLLRQTVRTEPQAARAAVTAAQKKFVHATRGRAIYMLAGLLKEERNRANAEEIASLLSGYEDQYPSMSRKFNDVFEWRMNALDLLGRYADMESALDAFLKRNGNSTANSDFIKEVGLQLWKHGQMKQAHGDHNGFIQDARLTAAAYGYFENQVKAGAMQAPSLTGTLSILAQAYLALGQRQKAAAVFEQVVKADPASPDANAGLARIAQSKKDYKDAVDRWASVESTAAESDNLWYDARYNIAWLYAQQGNVQGACAKLAQTRTEHPSLGTPEMKAKWDALQRKLCLDRKGGP
jgi:tetratricopeptide (TPR) repeat protein